MILSNQDKQTLARLTKNYGRLIGSIGPDVRALRDGNDSRLDRFAEYRTRPLDFVRDVLGKRLWAAERAIIENVLEHRMVAIRSCRKGGKTFTLAVLVETFENLWPTICVTIAPTHRQVEELLWSEINQIHADCGGELLGVCGKTQLRIGPRHYAIGFSTDRPGRIQGFHAGVTPPDDPDSDLSAEELADRLKEVLSGAGDGVRLLLIFDEAAEVAQALYEAMKGSLSGPNVFLVLAGNPIMDSSSSHEFARAHQPGSGYRRIKITAIDGHDDPLDCDEEYRVPNWMVPESYIDDRRRDWGEESPLFKAYVLGQFAGVDSEWRVIRPELLVAAEARDVHADIGVHVGIDVSRTGKDECAASRWAYGVMTAEYVWNSDDLMQTVTIIEALRVKWGENGKPLPSENLHVDVAGLGGGVVDRLRQKGLDVDDVDFGAGPEYEWESLTGETRFANRRAELIWVFRRALEEGIAKLPRRFGDAWMQAQYAEYELRVRGGETVIQIEPKDKIKKRHGRSPDNFDAAVMAWSRSGSGVFQYVGKY